MLATVTRSLVIGLFLAGCVGDLEGPGQGPIGGDDDIGDEVPGSPDAGTAESFAVTVSPPLAELSLNTSTTLSVTITSNGYDGPVNLSVSGVPESWSTRFLPAPAVALTKDGTATVDLDVTVPSNGQAATAQLVVTGENQLGLEDGFASVVVNNELVIEIPAGTDGGAHPFPPGIAVQLGASVRFLNADTSIHRIHSDNGGSGFAHQGDESGTGDSYTVTPSETGGLDYYCHEHGSGSGRGVLLVE